MAEKRNALTARDSHIWTLRMALMLLIGLLAGVIYLFSAAKNDFTCHVPPDLSRGGKIKPGDLVGPNSYSFANYMWREINEWQASGKTEFAANIEANRCYLSVDFYNWLKKLEAHKKNTGELDRERRLVPIQQFRPNMAKKLGDDLYVVYLDMRLTETVAGEVVKDIGMRYPLRVYADHRDCNVMGMAVDGFESEPTRFDLPEGLK